MLKLEINPTVAAQDLQDVQLLYLDELAQQYTGFAWAAIACVQCWEIESIVRALAARDAGL